MSHHTADKPSSTADSSSFPPPPPPPVSADPTDTRTYHLYSLLGVARTADRAEIKRVFRQAVRLHPDLPGGHEEQFKAIVLAGEILRDETKRTEYDQLGDAGIHQIQAMFMSDHDCDPLPDTSSSESTIHKEEEEEEEDDEENENEKKDNNEAYQKKNKKTKKNKKPAAATATGAAASAGVSASEEPVKRKAKAPPPIYITAHVSIEDMIRGSVDVAFYRHISDNAATPSVPMADKMKKTKKKTPPKRTRVAARATIDLPDGYLTNPALTVKLAAAGHFDIDTGKAGSVIVAFAAKPHKWLTRSGFDLISSATIRPIDMVLGRDFFVPYLDNRWIRVNAGKLPSFRLCFAQMGIPNGDVNGNLYVELKVMLQSDPLDATASRVLAAVFDTDAAWSPDAATIIDVPHDPVCSVA